MDIVMPIVRAVRASWPRRRIFVEIIVMTKAQYSLLSK